MVVEVCGVMENCEARGVVPLVMASRRYITNTMSVPAISTTAERNSNIANSHTAESSTAMSKVSEIASVGYRCHACEEKYCDSRCEDAFHIRIPRCERRLTMSDYQDCSAMTVPIVWHAV
jgi:hypothetical protein